MSDKTGAALRPMHLYGTGGDGKTFALCGTELPQGMFFAFNHAFASCPECVAARLAALSGPEAGKPKALEGRGS